MRYITVKRIRLCTKSIVGYLENTKVKIVDFDGSSIIIRTNKSPEGLSQELRRVIGMKINVKEHKK